MSRCDRGKNWTGFIHSITRLESRRVFFLVFFDGLLPRIYSVFTYRLLVLLNLRDTPDQTLINGDNSSVQYLQNEYRYLHSPTIPDDITSEGDSSSPLFLPSSPESPEVMDFSYVFCFRSPVRQRFLKVV